ncbi:hypothetical protein ISS86_00710 [Candidatus Microgenomates bacterium]|nr:hypothetical protein [Candidatus Microgenomates bacterium]
MDKREEEFRQSEEPRAQSGPGGLMELGLNLGRRSLKGLGKKLGNFLSPIKALGGRLLTKVGIKAGLTAVGTVVGATFSFGTTLLVQAGIAGLGLVKRGISFLANLGASPEPGKRDGGCLIAAGAIVVLAGLFILALFSSLQTMTSFTVRPHQSQKTTTLGVTEEKISTPSATPQPEAGHPLDDTFIPEP